MSTPPSSRGLLWPATMPADVVVVDVEGNGAQPPEIIEIAVLPLARGRTATEADLRTWLVRPEIPISVLVTRKVHGIGNADVADAPRWAEIAGEITAAMAGRTVVAHNAATERRVLCAHLPGWAPPRWLDTLRLAKTVWPELPGGYGLDRLIDHAHLVSAVIDGSATDGDDGWREWAGMRRHRAGYDTWMTAALLIALVTDGGPDPEELFAAARLPDPSPSRTARPSPAPTPGEAESGLW